ncbi:MAG: hypothetical protein H6Q75_1352 [Firmicutes bacterium]|nr:hypothetical protein [Bacillota bacterium]
MGTMLCRITQHCSYCRGRLMAQTGRRLFDGNGAVRVAERMTGVSE